MGGVRGETTEDDIVFETKLQDFECLVRPEAVGFHGHIYLPIGRGATEMTAYQAVSGARQIEELLQL